jgi:hypothetical protein
MSAAPAIFAMMGRVCVDPPAGANNSKAELHATT